MSTQEILPEIETTDEQTSIETEQQLSQPQQQQKDIKAKTVLSTLTRLFCFSNCCSDGNVTNIKDI